MLTFKTFYLMLIRAASKIPNFECHYNLGYSSPSCGGLKSKYACLQKRKLRKKESNEAGLDIAALEAEAAAHDSAKDRGSRNQRIARDAEQAAATVAEETRRKERYVFLVSFEYLRNL